ncbi:ComF family protein [Streptomyces violaceus]|uniref:ComF family protein n=1 Tax=Streptomyces violaceus TaxID=1936 RepID=A0ABY9UEZ4_STRVL|nr:ComF family protein [Streptomyces janthinus]WND21467.1 ComF family protein [Streptomyces janthinus]GGS45324.1 amidophosphoribosyltransferase [Streptomyces janthinus]
MTAALPDPAGFPNCPACAYVVTGTARLCSNCAGRTLQPVADSHCPVCSQAVASNRQCSNRLCALPEAERGFSRVDAVAVYSGGLRDKIHRLKYDGAYGWAIIFGRLLVGWMESHPEQMRGVDHVVGNPTAVGRQPIQHIEAIMDAAYTEDVTHTFPLSPPGAHRLVKETETPRSANKSLDDKRLAATAHAAALTWTGDTGDIKGRTILLVDDVFTSGAQLQHVALRLRASGAADVRGLVLARVPWGG